MPKYKVPIQLIGLNNILPSYGRCLDESGFTLSLLPPFILERLAISLHRMILQVNCCSCHPSRALKHEAFFLYLPPDS